MADQEGGKELPQRVRGAARGGSAPSATPVMSEEVRQRIQAAVKAERAEVTGPEQDQTAEPTWSDSAAGRARGTVSPASKDTAGKRPDTAGKRPRAAVSSERTVKHRHAANSEYAARPESVSKPQVNGNVPADHRPAAAAPDRPAQPRARGRTKPRGRLTALMVALALIVIASLGIMLAKSAASRSGGSQDSATLQHQELVARDQAASWIVQQVAPTAVVSCDRVMCAALTADRFPSGQLLTLTPASLTPVTSTVVVVTAAVRSMFGTSLGAAYAPAVLASFGSGDAEITIRLMAPHGAAAYQAMFKADLAARQESGSALVNNPRIILSGTAKDQLNAGQVDSRLVLSLADLASYQPIDIVRFDSIGPGAGPDILLRAADLDVNDQAVSMGSSAYTQAMYAYLDKQITKFRPASSQRVALPGGQPVFRVEFTAPSPLGGVQ